MLTVILSEMYANSQSHHTASKNEQDYLAVRNFQLGTVELKKYGVNAYRTDSGVWKIEGTDEKLFKKYANYIRKYHTGGIVGDAPSLKQNEVLALLEKDEAVLNREKKDGLFRMIEFVTTLSEKFGKALQKTGMSSLAPLSQNGLTEAASRLTSNISSSHAVNIAFGPTYIYGANEETVAKHRAITRQQANEIFDTLNIRR